MSAVCWRNEFSNENVSVAFVGAFSRLTNESEVRTRARDTRPPSRRISSADWAGRHDQSMASLLTVILVYDFIRLF